MDKRLVLKRTAAACSVALLTASLTACGGGGGETASLITFASGYTSVDPASVGYQYVGKSTELGNINWTVDPNNTDWNWGGDVWWFGVASDNFYWGGPSKSGTGYLESWVNAPENGSVSLSGQSYLKISVWGNADLVGAPRFTPVIRLSDDYSGCRPRAEAPPITPFNANPATYRIKLSDFAVVESCGNNLSISQFMSRPIDRVSIRIYRDNYFGSIAPNGINLGQIYFTP